MKTYEIKIHIKECELRVSIKEMEWRISNYLRRSFGLSAAKAPIRVVELDTIEGYVNE